MSKKNLQQDYEKFKKKYHYQPRKIHITAYYHLLQYNNTVTNSLLKFLVIKNMRSFIWNYKCKCYY